LLWRAAGQRRRVEGAELGRHDAPGGVALRDTPVHRCEDRGIENALSHEELAPQLVGVTVEERAVEIELRQRARGAA
jgi:hypothetical protein